MDEKTRQRFLDTWEEIGHELTRCPELEDSLIGLANDQELVSEDSMHIPAANLFLLVAQWMTKVIGISTTYHYDQDAFDQRTQEGELE